MTINKVVRSFDEAVADVFDGAVILVGGFGPANGCPSYLLRALVRQGAKNLTIVANTPGYGRRPPGTPSFRKTPPHYDDGGLLIQTGQVSKAICAFPGISRPGNMSPLHEKLQAGEFEVELVTQGTLAERIRAAKAGIPAFYTPTGVGTLLAEGKEVREFDGVKAVLEYPLKADFALVRAHKGDRWGNLVYQGTSRNFNEVMAGAATVTIAEVDIIVELGDLDPEAVVTPAIYVDRLASRESAGEEN